MLVWNLHYFRIVDVAINEGGWLVLQRTTVTIFLLLLRPEFGALAMLASSITVVTSALLLHRRVPRLAVGAVVQPAASYQAR